MTAKRDVKKARSKASPIVLDERQLSLDPLADSIGFHSRLASDASQQAFLARFGDTAIEEEERV